MIQPQTFRKKPVQIEAIQWTGENTHVLIEWLGESFYGLDGSKALNTLKIEIVTLEGRIFASISDWVIKGVKGEFYPCRDDIFRATYERDDGAPV